MSIQLLKILAIFAFLAIELGSHFACSADNFPNKPVRVVVGFLPGGPADVVLRPVGQKLSELLGQPVVIDNRPGANGNIGAEAVAKAVPDGYTLLAANIAQLTNNPSLYPNMPFDTAKDLAPITLLATSPSSLVVNPSVPVTSLKELIALAKRQPGKLSFSSTGNGSANHLAGELFKLLAHINMVHIPYKGGGPALNAVVGGEIELIFISLPSSLPFIKAGRLRALALCAPKRSVSLPQLQTTAEAGLPGLESTSGHGLLAPARTPKAIIARLHAETVNALSMPEVRDRLTAQGLNMIGNTPEEFAALIREESARWAKVVKAANVKFD